MNQEPQFSQKFINALLKLNFFLALLILFVELFKHGVIEDENFWINEGFIITHTLFAIVNVILSYWAYKQHDNYKPIRFILFLMCVIYLIMCILWALGYHSQYLNIHTYVIVFGNFLALVAIGYQFSKINYSKIYPAFLFVLSFIFLIILGTIALMLPHATVKPIEFSQALFTATSAVTVTGLAVLDTGKDFTFLGQIIILTLIQLGGIGILTITNLFSVFFKSDHSFKERIAVSNITNEENTAKAFSKLVKIVIFTLIIETVGVILIYWDVEQVINDKPLFFAIFHSVSAFCNAGFSTLSNSLYQGSFQFDYTLQLIIIWLLVSGAMGYSILINDYSRLKNIIFNFSNKLFNTKFPVKVNYKKISLNTLLASRTTYILLALGFIGFFLLEQNNTLANHDTVFGKIVVTLFNSATPRTAGFNDVDMAQLGKGTLIFMMFLMWIGASPGSTGGGIKTTTFAVAFLNLISQIKGRQKVIVNYRQIPTANILVVNATIMLSILTLGIGSLLLTIMNPEIPFESLLFECISAYSTVGLSVGITSDLNLSGEIFLMLLMFLGRVSFFTLLIGLVGQFSKNKAKEKIVYPKEDIFI